MGTFVNDFVHGLKASSSGTLLPIQAVGLNYLKCATAAGTAEKAVSALTGFKLLEGASVVVSFANTNTAANPTLKVGTTAAKPIYYRGSAISAGYLAAGRVYQFTYDGNYWQLIGDLNTDSSAYQNAVTTANTNFPIILGYDGRITAVNGAVNKSSTLLFNPSTNLLSTPKISVSTTATFNGSTAIDNATIGDLIVNGSTSFSNIPTAPTAADGTNNSQLATTEFVYNAFRVNDAMVFKGVVNSNSELPATHKQGWVYKVGTAGTYAGQTCEVGDTIYCVTDGTTATNAHWVVVQNNIDTLPVARGGTGATTAAAARSNLGTWSLISNVYNTLMPADGSTNDWVKIGTANSAYGILPSLPGAARSGHNYIGTAQWYWHAAYIDEIYGYLNGNISGNALTATKLLTARSVTIGANTLTFDGSANLTYKMKDMQIAPEYHFGTQDSKGDTNYILITLNKETYWMYSFILRVYQGYNATDYLISGYNYSSNHWHLPKCVVIASTTTTATTVYFGYTGNYKLWVAVPSGDYTGAAVTNLVNGYSQADFENAITITRVSELPGTLLTSASVVRPWYRDEAVNAAYLATSATYASQATSANIATAAYTLYYDTQKTTSASLNEFNFANRLSVTTWNGFSDTSAYPGVSNGVIINGGWNSNVYGFQIAIDDDPTYFIALRQRNNNSNSAYSANGGWNAWKRIVVADASTWNISISGTASKLTDLTVSDSASVVDNWRNIWMSYLDGVTGRPAIYNDLAYNTATNTLKATSFKGTKALMLLTGTAIAGTYSSGTYTPVKWIFNKNMVPTDGDIFVVKVPANGITNSDYGVFMTLDNGSHYYPIARNGQGRLTSHYPVGSTLILAYESDGSVASMFALNGSTGRTTITGGCFRVINTYDDGNSGVYANYLAKTYKAGGTAITAYDLVAEDADGLLVPAHKVAHKVGCGIYVSTSTLSANSTGSWAGLHDRHYSILIRKDGSNLTTTAYQPLFLKGTISNGIFTPDTTTPYVCGKANCNVNGAIYMFVGAATTSNSYIAYNNYHPYYYCDGTNLKLYSEVADIALKALELRGSPQNTSAGVVAAPTQGNIHYVYNVNVGTTGLFPNVDNSNSILTLNRHGGNYNTLLGFSSNGQFYYRSFSRGALDTTTPWKQIAFVDTVVNSASYATTAGGVAWSNVTGKPSTFTPSSHTHSALYAGADNRAVATTPNTYNTTHGQIAFLGLKNLSTIGTLDSNTYAYLLGLRGWGDSSGGDSHELAFTDSGFYWRHGATTTWGAWNKIVTTQNGVLTHSGPANFSGATTADNLTVGDLIVNGSTQFSNIPTAPTAADGTNDTHLATTQFVYNAFRTNDAMVFKGVVNSNSELPATHYQGWTYKIGTSGTYAGLTCEVGDTIYCITDGTSANNAHWVVVLNNLVRAVVGPASATNTAIARFDGTTGLVILNSTVTIDNAGNIVLPNANVSILRVGRSVSWHTGRVSALVRTTSINGYGALASIKTTNGSWDIGAYDNSSYTDDLLFTYVTDTQYNGSTAASTALIKFLENGHISAAGLRADDCIRLVRNSAASDTGPDAIFYIENKTNDDWALKIDIGNYSYGLNIKGEGNHLLTVTSSAGTTLLHVNKGATSFYHTLYTYNIYPNANNTYNLGHSSYNWNNVLTKTVTFGNTGTITYNTSNGCLEITV